jgi:hypothetical protein
MDSTTLLLVVVPLLLGLVTGAFKFMRLVGWMTGSRRRTAPRSSYSDDLRSFDERLAEKLRELEKQPR